MIQCCIDEGLVGGDQFGVDASLIKADARRHTKVEAADWSPPIDAPRAVRDYLDTLDDAAFSGLTKVKPKALSPADPAARFTGANGDRAFFAYPTNDLADLENAVIFDVEATAPIRQAEAGAAQAILLRAKERSGLCPELLAADTAYGSADMLGWLVEDEGIEPLIPVYDKSERKDGAFPTTDFIYDHEADEYTCPDGKAPKPFWRTYKKERSEFGKDGFKKHSARQDDCAACVQKAKCTPMQENRWILRFKNECPRQMARDIAKTDAYVSSSYARKKVEMLLPHPKRIIGLDRLRLRGPNGAKDEFHRAAMVQDLRKLAKLAPNPT